MVNDVSFSQANSINLAYFWMSDGMASVVARVMIFFKISNTLYQQTTSRAENNGRSTDNIMSGLIADLTSQTLAFVCTSKSFRIFELNGAILLTLIFLFELLKYYLQSN